jgi:hypothetical protein
MLSVVMLSVIMLSVVKLNVVVLSVVISVIMLSVVAPQACKQNFTFFSVLFQNVQVPLSYSANL